MNWLRKETKQKRYDNNNKKIGYITKNTEKYQQ